MIYDDVLESHSNVNCQLSNVTFSRANCSCATHISKSLFTTSAMASKEIAKGSKIKLTETYLSYPLAVLYVFGLWKRENHPYLYFMYSFFFLFATQYAYAMFQIIYMAKAWGDIEKIAEASFLLLTQATLCVKIILFTWKKSDIENLIENMDEDIFFPRKETQWAVIKKSVIIQKFEFFLFIFMSSFTIVFWAIFPLIDAGPQQKVLPFKAWYPLPTEVTPYYELLYFYQISCIWFSALINISIDRLSTAMTANGCAQVEILMDNLINIENYATDYVMQKKSSLNSKLIQNGGVKSIKKDLDISYPDLLKINDKIIHNLNDCIRHHQSIVRFVGNVEGCFNLGILAQFAASVGIICITGLQITLISPASLKFVSKILYLMAMLAQVLFICRIGNDITTVSEEISGAAYFSPWIDREKKYRTTLLIFMERLKQPIITRAGNFFPLSLQTFVTLLRSSYSYFAVLQQLNTK
ncbi:odorant receptor Or1-like [Arctopsyche grandis]|uniref:odorant receptor Or1-like n=1 Tax=Arctopsyche grandis TaxID=121162 RepID=UPI00406D7D2A